MIARILGLVPAWAYAAAVLALGGLLGVQTVRVYALQASAAKTAKAHADALAAANAQQRETERRWTAATQEVETHANTLREMRAAASRALVARTTREADAARAWAARPRGPAAGDGLRLGAADGRAGDGPAPGATGSGDAADATGRMYAELYGWAAERLAVVARYADDAAAAGLACQRAYEVTR